ncbi:MAG: NAD(P)/FAD-dependent oxidoreductase [Actinomycetota bacterium]|nr:NAD(P)/FAD-dependent oxidoreductase [Actinomycetota bacterium]
MIDVLVAGAGPVGLASALYLHQQGLQVTVAEPRPGPIDKACGEGLLPAAVRALANLGVRPTGRELRGIRYSDGQKSVSALFGSGTGRGVRRTELQACLSAAVLDRGIPIVQAAVTGIEQDRRTVTAAGLTARYLVAADGLHSGIRQLLDLADPRPTGQARRWGQRRHFRLQPWSNLVEVHWSGSAEAYVTPIAEDQLGVAILSSRREPFEQQLQGFPELAGRLAGYQGSPVLGAGPLRQRVRARVAGRVLLVGDAAGYLDALTGEGISVGLHSARRLADCLSQDRPQDYERAWLRSSRRYRLLTGSLLYAAERPVLRRRIVPAAAGAPWLFSAVVNQLSP